MLVLKFGAGRANNDWEPSRTEMYCLDLGVGYTYGFTLLSQYLQCSRTFICVCYTFIEKFNLNHVGKQIFFIH